MRTTVPLDRVRGCLLGVAVGDALGLPLEGLAPRTIARRFPSLDRYFLLGRLGFVSDDTEQTALMAQALVEGADADAVVARFRRHLRWWFARLPFGIGLATLRACVKLWFGLTCSGVGSGGNGAAMRSTILGVVVDDPAARQALGRRLAEVTHTHPLAVEGALFVAEVAARCARSAPETSRESLVRASLPVLKETTLRGAVESALTLSTLEEAITGLGTTGFVVHSVGLCTWAFATGRAVHDTLALVIRAGGDTDTHAAIVGGWTGALHGDTAIPEGLRRSLQDGAFGPTHLEGLARSLVEGAPLPRWSAVFALLRNLALYPVVLAHGFRRLIPFG